MKVIKKGQGTRYVPPGHDNTVSAVKLFNANNGSPNIDAHITTFLPGAGMDEETHEVSEHILYMLKGRLEVRKAGAAVAVIEEGDAIHIPAGEPHQVVNPGPGEGVFYVVTVPPAG